MINNITVETSVTASMSQNKTTFSIDVGLHPKDADKIQDAIIKILNEDCNKTKEFIDDFNKNIPKSLGVICHECKRNEATMYYGSSKDYPSCRDCYDRLEREFEREYQ